MMILFYFDYSQSPLRFTPSNDDAKKALNYKSKAVRNFNKKHDPRNVGRGMKEMIESYALHFGFNAKDFMNRNFEQQNKHVNLKIHNDLFRGVETNNPWCCDKFNYHMILEEIYQEAEDIKNLSPEDLNKESVLSHVSVPNSSTKAVDKSIIEDDNKKHPASNDHDIGVNPLCAEVRHKLGKLWSPYDPHYYNFQATYDGIRKTSHNSEKGALLTNIYHNGTMVSTHNWLWQQDLDHIKSLNMVRGEQIQFSAIVVMYRKRVIQTNGGVCDFNVANLKHIKILGLTGNKKPISTATRPTSDTDKISLAKAIGSLFDKQQLKHLIRLKMTLNQRNINRLDSRLTLLRKRVALLQHQDHKLKYESNSAKTILTGKSSDKGGESQENASKATITHQTHSQTSFPNITLVGSSNDLAKVYKLWNDPEASATSSHVLGIYNHLTHFVNVKDSSLNKALDSKSFMNVVKEYQHAEVKALIEYYTRDSYTTIKSIERSNGLVSGTLLRLRRNHSAKAIAQKKIKQSNESKSKSDSQTNYVNSEATKKLLDKIKHHNA